MSPTDSTARVAVDAGTDLGPGERLREAREAAGLSLAEVASRLRLEERAVRQLEADNYEGLHGPTFVRGYLAGYARLLNLPERPVMEAYERRGHGPPEIVADIAAKPQVRVSDFPVRVVTYLIAALLVVLVVLWWHSRQPVPVEGTVAGGEAEATAEAAAREREEASVAQAGTGDEASVERPATIAGADAGSGSDPVVVAATPQSVTEVPPASLDSGPVRVPDPADAQGAAAPDPATRIPVPPAESTPAENAVEGGDAAVAAVGTSSTEVSRAAEEAMVAAVEPESEAPALSSSADAGGATNEPAVAVDDARENQEQVRAPRPEPLPGSDVLRIQLVKESWVEIYDRGGGRLFYSLAAGGSEVMVRGAGPMEVLLGDVEGAEVAYNEEPYDMSRFQGRSVVRFTVGNASVAPTTESREPLTRGADQESGDAAAPVLAGHGTRP